MKFFEENEAKLKTQLELLSKDRGDLSILLETLHHKTNELDKLEKFKASPQREIIISDDPRRRKFEELELENMEFIRNNETNRSELKNLREALERNRLEVRQATLYDRPTKLQGEDGLHNWLAMFGSGIAGNATEEQRNRAYANAIERLKPALYREGSWWADYRRIQIVAVKKG